MKFLVIVLACVAAASAQLKYFPTPSPFKYTPFASTPAPFKYYSTRAPVVQYSPTPAPVVRPVSVSVVKAVSDSRNANTLNYVNEAYPDGRYNYGYETDNGIAAQAQGVPRDFGGNPPVVPVVSQGSFSWTSPEGVPILITYIADENGYQPQGDALPTPPPLPAQIARALAYQSNLKK